MIRLGLCCTFRDRPIKFRNATAAAIAKMGREDGLAKLSDLCAEVAEWIGADAVDVHGGGGFGDKRQSLVDFARALDRPSPRARVRLTVENDDRIFTPADLPPVRRSAGVPLVYDVHHHRCDGDGRSVEGTTERAVATWDREPLFHLSSPIAGWSGPGPERRHDYIDPAGFPGCWRGLDLTVEVEAKAKEAAVFKLKDDLRRPRG